MSQLEIYSQTKTRRLIGGGLAVLPLSIAVIPWGVLAGSYAIEAGLNVWEAQMMSLILFAGSAQLVALEMFKSGVGLGALLLTILVITSRHFLYSISMREKLSRLPACWRLILGFWLTDELFAICGGQSVDEFDRWYAIGAGMLFYLIWNISSLVGIIAGSYFPSLNEIGLDFAVAATFIAIVIPQIISIPVLVCVITTLIISVFLSLLDIDGVLIIASLCGMTAGYGCELLLKRGVCSGEVIKGDKA